MSSAAVPPPRPAYPTDIADDEWAFVPPYLALLPEDTGQRKHDLREVFDALRWLAKASAWLADFAEVARSGRI